MEQQSIPELSAEAQTFWNVANQKFTNPGLHMQGGSVLSSTQLAEGSHAFTQPLASAPQVLGQYP